MSQHYSDPSRADDAYALPDVETFYVTADQFLRAADGTWEFEAMSNNGAAQAEDTDYPATIGPELRRIAKDLEGWYVWSCLPGCLPDSDPFGPYDTEADALADAQERE